jgi:hypothetical protein
MHVVHVQTQAYDPVQEQKIYKIRKVVASGAGSVWFLMEHKLDTMLGFCTGSHTSSHGNITLKFFLCSLHMVRIVILKDKSSVRFLPNDKTNIIYILDYQFKGVFVL